jgi:uncharacterized membrane protein YeaQ/YmgE (transglycosylase-associated protein family)
VGIIAWIILGLLAGLIARALVRDDPPGGVIVTTLVGIAGALIAGFIAQAIGWGNPVDEFWSLSTWLSAIIGAVVLLVVWRAVAAGGRGRRFA